MKSTPGDIIIISLGKWPALKTYKLTKKIYNEPLPLLKRNTHSYQTLQKKQKERNVVI